MQTEQQLDRDPPFSRQLGLEPVLNEAFAEALEALNGGRSFETRNQSRRHIKTFARFLVETKILIPFPNDVLLRFKNYLKTLNYSPRYTAQIHQCCLRVLRWIERNTTDVVHRLQDNLSARIYQPRTKVLPSNLQSLEVKAILRAAYRDIDEIEAKFNSVWQSIENGSHEHLSLIRDVLHEGMRPPLKRQRELGGALHGRVGRNGGLRALRVMLFPTAADIFPYYIAILCQCSANPMAIRHLRRDCIVSHPLRVDRERIIWDKPRAGYEQKADFNVKRPYSAPNLIRRLIRLNARLSSAMDERDKELLFLAYGSAGITVPSWQAIHDLHQAFIAKHELKPHFLKDFRKAGAELHAVAAGTLLRAKSRLNHQSVQTTRGYVAPGVLAELHDDRISMHQSRLHEMTGGIKQALSDQTGIAHEGSAETVFGFTCKDPWAGVQKGQEGKRCLKFTGCATCPGAVVTLDDVNVVARLLAAVAQLTEAKLRATKEGWLDRYNVLYEATLNIIEVDLLPKVSAPILTRAKRSSAHKKTLFLE